MAKPVVKRYWKTGVGEKIVVTLPHGRLEGYIVCKNGSARRKLANIDAGARLCGLLADSIQYKRVAYLAHLDVDESFRKEGIGTKLIEKFTCEVAKHKVSYIFLIANPPHMDYWDALIRFYRRQGFKLNKNYDSLMYKRMRYGASGSREDASGRCAADPAGSVEGPD